MVNGQMQSESPPVFGQLFEQSRLPQRHPPPAALFASFSLKLSKVSRFSRSFCTRFFMVFSLVVSFVWLFIPEEGHRTGAAYFRSEGGSLNLARCFAVLCCGVIDAN